MKTVFKIIGKLSPVDFISNPSFRDFMNYTISEIPLAFVNYIYQNLKTIFIPCIFNNIQSYSRVLW